METPAQALAKAITHDRERLGISQEKIANEVEVTQQAVSGWEAGESFPRKQRLYKLANLFGEGSNTWHVVFTLYGQTKLSQEHRKLRDEAMHFGPEGEHLSPDVDHFRPKSMRQSANSEHIIPPNLVHRPWPSVSMGEQASSERRRSTDVGEEHAPSHYIPSFEVQPTADVRDSLTRAKNGLTLARQVLEDATAQVDRALASLK